MVPGQRAGRLMSTTPASATAELETVIASVRNFSHTTRRARLLPKQIRKSSDERSRPARADT